MPNTAIVELLTQHLQAGLQHPGNPATGQPPIRIPFAPFRTAGMATQQAEQVRNTVALIPEAIVHIIETEGGCEIVPRAELEKLRVAELPVGTATPVICSVCREPMFWINTTDGPAFVNPQILAGANPDCPHEVAAA